MRRVDQIAKALNDVGCLDEYNGEIFRAIVENVAVRNTYTLVFHLKVSIVESITITRKYESPTVEKKGSPKEAPLNVHCADMAATIYSA